MAKDKNKKDGTPAASTGAKKGSKGETPAQMIARGPVGIVKLIALKAVQLAARNGFAGTTPASEAGFDPKNKKMMKNAGNRIQSKFVPGSGTLYKVSPDNASFVEIKALAKAATADIKDKNYSSDVKAFLNKLYEGTGRSGGATSFNTDALNDLGNW